MKKIGKNLILLIVATLVVLVFILKDNLPEIIRILSKVDLKIFIIGIILFCISDILKAYSYHQVFKNSISTIKFFDSYKITIISNFFNYITPFNSGGNPYQIYTLKKKHDVAYSKGISITMFNFLIYQISTFLILSVFVIINSIYKFLIINELLSKFIILGYIVHTTITLFIISIVYIFNGTSLNSLLRFMNKIKILKEEKLNRMNLYIFNFYSNLKDIRKKIFLLIKCIILNFLVFLTLFFIPIIVFKSLGYSENINLLSSFIASSYIILIAGFVPIPGGVIGVEYGFISFFGIIIKGAFIKAGLLLWRFITYYFSILFGSILFILNKKE